MPRPARKTDSPPEFFSAQVREAKRFYLNLKPRPDCPLAVVCGGREHCAPDYAIRRAGFAYFSLEFVARGNGSLTLRKRTHDLQQGSLFCYGPGIPQAIKTDPERPLVKYFVDFAGSEAEALLRVCRLKPGAVARVAAPNEIQTILDDLIRNGLRGGRYSARICTNLLEYLALKIAESRAPKEGFDSLAYATYQQCRQHIQEHFQRLRNLEQVARECHLDASYLCRLFHRFDDRSPYQYLLRLKMNLAAEQLLTPSLLIKQIAENVGFNDPFHFSRTFKRAFGLSPDAFRRVR